MSNLFNVMTDIKSIRLEESIYEYTLGLKGVLSNGRVRVCMDIE